jgi:choline transport protein
VHNETVPRNAVYVTCVISILLALINLGSSIAFNAILSLQLLALMSTYCISIGCVLYKRLTKQSLPPAQWSLGRWGVWVNAVGFVYSFFILFWAGWPEQQAITAVTLNWAPVIFAGVLIFSLSFYLVQGRKTYAGPVVLVRPAND